MANANYVEILRQGVEAWNQWRASNRDVTPNLGPDLEFLREANLDGINLSGADLSNARLQGTHMRQAILRNADLRRAELCACKLWGADLKFAHLDEATLDDSELNGADLSGASLREVDLSSTDLSGATFRGAVLQKTNLQVKRGILRPENLAGADLTGAQLPESLEKLFGGLKAVDEISESAKKLFIAMLAACLYCWLTIATTTDLNLITNRSSSPLPIIQTSIPIVGFYVVAPLLLISIYFYFHFYLQKLWEELGSLPAIFPDGRRLHQRSDPWLLNDLVRSHVALLRPDRPFMSYFQQTISIVLAWWLVPFTLFLFWGRYLPRHDFRWTTLQVVLLAISITAATFLYRLAGASLHGAERLSFRPWTSHLKNQRFYGGIVTFVVTGVVLTLVSIGAIRSSYPQYPLSWLQDPAGCWSWTPRAMALVGYSPFANLRRADVSVKPSNWTGKNESELDGVKGAEMEDADLRYAEANGAFLAKADLSGARLEGADLTDSDLRQARFIKLDIRSRQPFAGNADLTGANLSGANLRGAFLRVGHLPGAYLVEADLTGALLNSADLIGTQLDGAELEFADFRSIPSDRTNPFLPPTRGLTVEQIKTAKDWKKAYYDDGLVKELGLPPDHNAKIDEERRKSEGLGETASDSTESPHDEKSPNTSEKRK